MKKDIDGIKDIQRLVDTFYTDVQNDPLIGGIFIGAIKDWTAHLNNMYSFWQTVLLEEHTYHGSPFPPHAQMRLQAMHFQRWLMIWKSTIDAYFEGNTADEAKWRAEKMATLFLSKIEYIGQNGKKSLI